MRYMYLPRILILERNFSLGFVFFMPNRIKTLNQGIKSSIYFNNKFLFFNRVFPEFYNFLPYSSYFSKIRVIEKFNVGRGSGPQFGDQVRVKMKT